MRINDVGILGDHHSKFSVRSLDHLFIGRSVLVGKIEGMYGVTPTRN